MIRSTIFEWLTMTASVDLFVRNFICRNSHQNRLQLCVKAPIASYGSHTLCPYNPYDACVVNLLPSKNWVTKPVVDRLGTYKCLAHIGTADYVGFIIDELFNVGRNQRLRCCIKLRLQMDSLLIVDPTVIVIIASYVFRIHSVQIKCFPARMRDTKSVCSLSIRQMDGATATTWVICVFVEGRWVEGGYE